MRAAVPLLASLAVACGGAPAREHAWLEDLFETPEAGDIDACGERWMDAAPQYGRGVRADVHPAPGVERLTIAAYPGVGLVVHVVSAACDAELARVVLRDAPRDVIGPTIETDASFSRAPEAQRAEAHATDRAPSGQEHLVGLVPLTTGRVALVLLARGAFGSGVVGYEATVVTCDGTSCRAHTVGQHEHARGPGGGCGIVRRVVRRERDADGAREIVLVRAARDGDGLRLERAHDDVDACAR